MSVFNALITGVSGLSAQSQALASISDNIANVNTVGFKRVSNRFQSLVTQSNQQVHTSGGIRSTPFYSVTLQGSILGTGGETDMAIIGDGFFVVNANPTPGVGDEYVYTRAGAFGKDKNGYIKNAAGLYLQGWVLDQNGNIPTNGTSISSLQTVNLSNISGAPRSTTNVSLGTNLPAGATTGSIQTQQVTMYDTLGVAQTVQMNWRKNAAANTWEMYFTPSASIAGYYGNDGTTFNALDLSGDGTPANNHVLVTFAADGSLADMTVGGTSILNTTTGVPRFRFNFSASGASATQNIDFNFGRSSTIANPLPALSSQTTQTGNGFRTNFVTQNGVAPGSFTGVSLSEDGYVTAQFDNGESRRIYKIPVATFPSPNGLEARNGNVYAQTERSGIYILREPNKGGAAKIAPNSLEQSNVDIAQEFANMILTQRAYSANTRVISTADDMLQELIQRS